MSGNESEEFYKLSAVDYKDRIIDFSIFKGRTVIITNMASDCGYAKSNLSLLADILIMYHDYGLDVLIFPCLQYTKDDTDILRKMYNKIMDYSDKFIVFSDISIIGKNIHPVYEHIIKWSRGFCGRFMKWNFPKFIIDGNGVIIKKLEPGDRLEINDRIFRKLLSNNPVEVSAGERTIRYSSDPYQMDDVDSSEEAQFL
jgi:glutathione peroxidase-family protein